MEGRGRTRGTRGSQRWLPLELGWSDMRWRHRGRGAGLLAGVGAEELPGSASELLEKIKRKGRRWMRRNEAEGPLNRGARGGGAGSRHCRAVSSSTASLAAGGSSRRGLRSTRARSGDGTGPEHSMARRQRWRRMLTVLPVAELGSERRRPFPATTRVLDSPGGRRGRSRHKGTGRHRAGEAGRS